MCVFFDQLDELEAEQFEYDRDEMGLDVPASLDEEASSGD